MSLWERSIGTGISNPSQSSMESDSVVAYPNIMPWSPAPCSGSIPDPESTPRAMSADCLPIRQLMVQVSSVDASIPTARSSYPISKATFLAIASKSTSRSPERVTSPARTMLLWSDEPLTRASTATLAWGSRAMHSSSIASDMASQSLSGCPELTDSDVNVRPMIIAKVHWSSIARFGKT